MVADRAGRRAAFTCIRNHPWTSSGLAALKAHSAVDWRTSTPRAVTSIKNQDSVSRKRNQKGLSTLAPLSEPGGPATPAQRLRSSCGCQQANAQCCSSAICLYKLPALTPLAARTH
jgi:hypothetical protein